MNAQQVGRHIAELRKGQSLTQAQLAEKLNVTDKAVSRWERGAGLPDINTIEPLSEALCVSVLEIMRGEKPPEEQCEHSENEIFSTSVGYITEAQRLKKRDLKILLFAITAGFICIPCFLFGLYAAERFGSAEMRNFYVILSVLPLSAAFSVFTAAGISLLEKSKTAKIIIGVCLVYCFFFLSVLFVFYAFGLYAFNMFPSKIVLIRLILYPAAFTAATLAALSFIKKKR